jgi:hypothetical protein
MRNINDSAYVDGDIESGLEAPARRRRESLPSSHAVDMTFPLDLFPHREGPTI